MFEQLFEGVLEVVVRLWSVWTLPLFTWMTQQIFLWMKGVHVAQLTSEKDLEKMQEACPSGNRNCIILSQSHYYSWNTSIMDSSAHFKKQYNPLLTRTPMCGTPLQMALQKPAFNTHSCPKTTPIDFLAYMNNRRPESCLLTATGMYENLEEFRHKFASRCTPSYPKTMPENMEHFAMFKDTKDCCSPFLLAKTVPVESESMGSLCFAENTGSSSVASIESGYRSYHSVKSGCQCIEEDGVTLFVTDCRYNKEGKLVSMSVGFDVFDESSSESCFEDETDDDGISSEDDASDDDDTDDEDFIVFDTHSWCPESKDSKNQCGISACISSFTIQVSSTTFPMWDSVDKTINSAKPLQDTTSTLNPQTTKDTTVNQSMQDLFDKELKVLDNMDNLIEIHDDMNSVSPSLRSAGAAKKRVTFKEECNVHCIVAWDYAYRAARKGEWKQYATDREHFCRRIEQAEVILKPVLLQKIAKAQNA